MKGVLSILVLMLAAALLPSAVFAAGTPAGTVITNTATLTYKDLGGTTYPAVTATIAISQSHQSLAALVRTASSGDIRRRW